MTIHTTTRRGASAHCRTLIGGGLPAILVFAAAHVYWALGGTVGVPAGGPITDRPVFLAYDIAAAVALIAAAAVAARLAIEPSRLLVRLTVVGATVALVRGLVGLTQDAATLAGGHRLGLGVGYDLWFALVGALFLAVAATGPGHPPVGGTTRTTSA